MRLITPSGRSPGDLFGDFLDLHDQCVAAGLMDAAYQALAGALHCAEASASSRNASLVVELARLRQRRLDGEVPRHRLSTFAAQLRGQTPLFESLAVAGLALTARLARGHDDSPAKSQGAEGA
jgi:hypothetical protein